MGTTAEGPKDTAPTLSTADDSRSTDAEMASTATESTTPTDSTEPADSREGYLPLRDKPHQNHVKINEQTKKEVSDLIPQSELCFFLVKIIHSLIVTTFLFSQSDRKFLIDEVNATINKHSLHCTVFCRRKIRRRAVVKAFPDTVPESVHT